MNITDMIEKIKETNLENKLVIFVGAGVSINSGYKSWQELIRQMDTMINYSKSINNKTYSNDELLRIPQYLQNTDPEKYLKVLEENFNWLPTECNIIVDAILELNPHHIITTNYDCLIEHSINKAQKDQIKKRKNSPFAIVKRDQDLVSTNKNNLLIKMHGDIEAFSSLVLKEKDYLNYSSSHCLIETFIKSLLIDHSFLFIGYGVGDYNLKLILNWFENIISSYNIDLEKRKKHYFINPDKLPMSKFDKQYFGEKNIEIIDAIDIPEEYKQIQVDALKDYRGKNTYKILKYIKNAEPNKKTVNYVFEQLKPFTYCNRVVFQDLIQVLTGSPTTIYKLINDEFHYHSEMNYDKSLEVAINVLKTKSSSDEEDYIKDVFIKAGVNKVVEDSKRAIFILNENKLAFDFYEAIVKKEFDNIYEIIDKVPLNPMITLYLKMFVGERDEVEEELKDIVTNHTFDSLTEHIILLHNASHASYPECAYPTELIEVLPIEEKRYISTMCDLNNGFDNLFSELATEIVEMQKKYSPYANNRISEHGVENALYKNISTQIINTMKYFICNGLYTFGCYGITMNLSGYYKLLELYVDNLFFLQSPNCEHTKYENFNITKDDLVIISSYLKADDILLMINKYGVEEIVLTEECIEYLLQSLRNIINEQHRKATNSSKSEAYLSQVALTICQLLKISILDINSENQLVEMACKFFSITSFKKGEYSYAVIRDVYSELLDIVIKLSWKTYNIERIGYFKSTILSITLCVRLVVV